MEEAAVTADEFFSVQQAPGLPSPSPLSSLLEGCQK
jgi:hypothetical protein